MSTITAPRPHAAPATAAALAAATPSSRFRYADLLRVVAIGVVVVGHWLLAVVTYEDGQLAGRNALELSTWSQGLTWVLQVMPLFFLVGGYANAASLERSGIAYGPWLRGRLSRLLRPTLLFAVAWSVTAAALAVAGVAAQPLALAAQLVAVPVWFLAVYVLVVAAASVAVAAHRRFGLRVPVALVAAVVAVDVLRLALGVPLVGWLNFPLVWLLPHQLGVAWRDGSLDGTRLRAGLALGGLTAVALLTSVGPYPLSMVGVPGAELSNNAPPSLALAAHSIWHAGLALLLQARAERWLQRPRVWRAVVAGNGVAMTVYLWHLTALVVIAAVALPLGFPQPEHGTLAYWALRPVWVVLAGVALLPLVALLARYERPEPRGPAPVTAGRSLAVVGLAAAGLALLATHGFRTGDLFGVPWPALGALTGAWWLARR